MIINRIITVYAFWVFFWYFCVKKGQITNFPDLVLVHMMIKFLENHNFRYFWGSFLEKSHNGIFRIIDFRSNCNYLEGGVKHRPAGLNIPFLKSCCLLWHLHSCLFLTTATRVWQVGENYFICVFLSSKAERVMQSRENIRYQRNWHWHQSSMQNFNG